MTHRACIFCRQRAEPGKRYVFGPTFRVRRGGRLRTSAVCEACHGGWIEQLEATVAPWVTEIDGTGDVARLQAPDRRLPFARWALQTACLVDAAVGTREICPCIPQQLWQQPLALPDHVHVLAAWHSGPHAAIAVNRRNLWTEYPLGVRCEEPGCHPGGKFKIAFAVGRLLVVVAGLPSAHFQLVAGRGLHVPIWPAEAAPLEQQFYPLRTTGVTADEALRHCSDLVALAHAAKMM